MCPRRARRLAWLLPGPARQHGGCQRADHRAHRRRSIDSEDGEKADELLASQPVEITAFMEDTLFEAEACLWQSSAMTGKGRCQSHPIK